MLDQKPPWRFARVAQPSLKLASVLRRLAQRRDGVASRITDELLVLYEIVHEVACGPAIAQVLGVARISLSD